MCDGWDVRASTARSMRADGEDVPASPLPSSPHRRVEPSPTGGRKIAAALIDAILDGEMMVWDQQVGRYSLFGDNRSMKDYKKRVESGCNSCYIVFDCLWLNGENLSGLPLSERRRRLDANAEGRPPARRGLQRRRRQRAGLLRD